MRFPAVPRRIRAMLGEAVRFIFCLRNPVTRAYSHYLQCVRMQEEGGRFERALELDARRRQNRRFLNRRRDYIRGGFYTEQIGRFLELFPAEQIRYVILEEDIQGTEQQRAQILAGLLDFLQVDSGFRFDFNIRDTRLPPPDIHFVGKGDRMRMPGMRKRAAAGSIVVNAHIGGANRYIGHPSPMAQTFYRRLEKNLTRSLAPETAAMLYETYFREEIDRVETLIGRDLSVWRPR